MPTLQELQSQGWSVGNPEDSNRTKAYNSLVAQGWEAGPAAAETPEVPGPGKTFLLNATNLFGAAPVLSGVIHVIKGDEPYEEARDRYRNLILAGSEENPKAALAGKITSFIPETVIGGAAGELVGAGAKASGLLSKLPAFATSGATGAVAKGILGGAGYGAATGAGEAASKGEAVLPAAAESAASGAVVGGIAGGLIHGAGALLKGAPAAERRDILQGIGEGSGDHGSATPTLKKRLVNIKGGDETIAEVLKSDPKLLKASRDSATKAIPIFEKKLDELGEKLDPAYKAIDEVSGGISVKDLTTHLNDTIADYAKSPLQEVYTSGLTKLRDSYLQAWAPEIKKTLESLEKEGYPSQVVTKMFEAIPDKQVPTQELRKTVSQLQNRATHIIDSLHPGEQTQAKGEFASIIKNYLDESLDKAGATDPKIQAIVDGVRDTNRQYNVVATALNAIKERGWKEQTGSTSGKGALRQLIGHGSAVGGAISALQGHPKALLAPLAYAAAEKTLPPLRRASTAALATLQKAAEAGNPKAKALLAGLKAGAVVATAGAAGNAGAVVNSTLGNE